MTDDVPPTFLARVARKPLPVLLGLAVGFLGCCVAGRVAARQQPYKDFVRFHPGIAPDSHFYPTYSQTLNLARQHVGPGKTLVVVGGNSVMHGVGQRPAHVWTKHLQELLGDGYVVLNLAMRAAHPHEFACLIAERLTADGVPVIYVASSADVFGPSSDWDGTAYKYLFWDAHGKGLLPDEERRGEWLDRGFADRYARDAAAHERRHQGTVDGVVYARDLWNDAAYRHRGTIWTPMKYPKFWRPHRESTDTDPGETFPSELIFRADTVDVELRILRSQFLNPPGDAILSGDGDEALAAQYRGYLAERMRPRTLFVFRFEAKFYTKRLSLEDYASYRRFQYGSRDALVRGGFRAQTVGEGYEERDYFDRSHFSERGGKKLAADLAPTVRAMNAELYGPNPRSTDAP